MQFGRRKQQQRGQEPGQAPPPEEIADREHAIGRLLEAGLHEDAEPLMRALLADYERHLGHRDPTTISLFDALGHTLYQLRRLPEAEAMHREAYQRSTVVEGPDHARTLTYAHNLGAALVIGEDPAQGIALLTRTLERREAVLGAEHRDALDTAAVLGAVLFATGERVRGHELLERTWTRYAAALGPDDLQTLAAAGNVAAAREALGRTRDAARLLEEVAQGYARVLGPEHELTRHTRSRAAAMEQADGPARG